MTDVSEGIDLDELRRRAEAELEKPEPPFLTGFDFPADVDESNLDDLTQHAFDAGTDWADWQNARTVLALVDRAESAERRIKNVIGPFERMSEEMGEAIGFDALGRGVEAEYPVSYFREKLDAAIDEALTEGDKQ